MSGKKFLQIINGIPTGTSSVQTSAGAANSGDIPALDSTGKLDSTMIPNVSGTLTDSTGSNTALVSTSNKLLVEDTNVRRILELVSDLASDQRDKLGSILQYTQINQALLNTLAAQPATMQCRLTLATGNPESNGVTGATTVYVTPCMGNLVTLFNSGGVASKYSLSEIPIPVPSSQFFRIYDVFLYSTGITVAAEIDSWDASQVTGTITGCTVANPAVLTAANTLVAGDFIGVTSIVGTIGTDAAAGMNGKVFKVASATSTTITLETGNSTTGLAYTSGGTFYKIAVSRSAAVSLKNGMYVKSSDYTRAYIGSFMTTGVTGGVTEDSTSHRLVFNYYNRIPRRMRMSDSTATWTYTIATYRPRNNGTSYGLAAGAGRCDCLIGIVSDDVFSVAQQILMSNTSAGVVAFNAIGVNSVSTPTTGGSVVIVSQVTTVNVSTQGAAYWETSTITAGYAFIQSLENSTATGTSTWSGANSLGGTTIISGRF